ncbi:MAG: UMP kinase [Oscillospiraceae bacterium]|nr:UMP kinase [Oscillospiraceae bacterium]
MSELKYKRILLKVSGEALGEKTAQGDGFGLNFGKIAEVASAIKECVEMGVQVGLVIGGGNFWRGVKNGSGKMQRTHADSMGMLATVMNAIAVADVLEQHGLDARVLTAVEMNKFAEYFTRDLANRYLNEGKVVLFAAGTGNPYFSTDTGAVLRGVEIEADAVLMAKNVDAIYSADPKKDPNAVRYSELTYAKVLEDGLKATDVTAMALAMDNNMPMVCFGLEEENSIIRVVQGEKIGTTVTN